MMAVVRWTTSANTARVCARQKQEDGGVVSAGGRATRDRCVESPDPRTHLVTVGCGGSEVVIACVHDVDHELDEVGTYWVLSDVAEGLWKEDHSRQDPNAVIDSIFLSEAGKCYNTEEVGERKLGLDGR